MKCIHQADRLFILFDLHQVNLNNGHKSHLSY